jgi:AcrR family transcriptional regulator
MSTRTVTVEHVPYAVAARELLRNTLLNAARDQLRSRTWADVTMSDIANTAGVSRQTLYKEFGSREAFAEILVRRETDSLLCAVGEAVNARVDTPVSALAAAFDVIARAVAESFLVQAIIQGRDAPELSAVGGAHEMRLIERATERLTEVILAGWPPVGRERAEHLSECVIRVAISYAALPKSPTGMSATSLARLLAPYMEQFGDGA